MQPFLEYVSIAFAGAIVMLLIIILIGVGIGYRDEIHRRRLDIYGRVIGTPLLLLASTYLYLQGNLHPGILSVAMIWLLPVLVCTDWGRLKRTKSAQEESRS